MSKHGLHGLIPPMPTPLKATDVLDVDGLERLVERLIEGGVHGLFLLGTTGEGPSHSYELRREFIKRTSQLVNGRIPTIVGITDTIHTGSLDIAEAAAESGATALVASIPYYMPPSQQELVGYFKRLVTQLTLPLMLYNMPSMTKITFGMEALESLMDEEKIIGMKDSGGGMMWFHDLIRLSSNKRPDWCNLVGPDELLLEALMAGADGGVCAGPMIEPSRYVKTYNAFRRGDFDNARQAQESIHDLTSRIYHINKDSSSVVRGVKGALGLLGVCDDFPAEPLTRFDEEEKNRMTQHLKELELL